MSKVVSIAVFGEGAKAEAYAQYLPAFVRAHLNLFPTEGNWRLRVHASHAVLGTHRGEFLRRLVNAGLVDLVPMPDAPLTKAMLWRLAPVFDPAVDYVFCRDLDACPMPRDRAVCDQFMWLKQIAGTCHDNLHHIGVMGGLCHFKAAAFREATGMKTLEDLYAFGGDTTWGIHGTDQNVLNRLIGRPGMTLLEHRFNGWTNGAPTARGREPGIYQCQAWSTPTPDVGTSRLTGDLAAQADRLANHLGAAGFDHLAARAFWDKYGDSDIAAKVADCERV